MRKIFDKIGNLPKDKILHFSISAILAGLIGAVLTHFVEDPQVAIAYGGISTVCLGVLKEMYDQFTEGEFDLKDLATDVAGSAVGTGIAIIPFI